MLFLTFDGIISKFKVKGTMAGVIENHWCHAMGVSIPMVFSFLLAH
jgi:hypothetical protein